MGKIYTVELQVEIVAENGDEAFQKIWHDLCLNMDITGCETICEPYVAEEQGEDE